MRQHLVMIIGTAGHIDHGKTALVRALTGVDTDRLPEEKRRGITIDLGFAPLDLGDGLRAGVVDVPGHEAFVRTMLAGATGIDVALIVVAGDEGVMPQTREHLDILSLLDVRHALVAIAKADLVEEDWLTLVTEDVRALLAGTAHAHAPIIPTSIVSGSGLTELRARLAQTLRDIPQRQSDDLFRMPIDRAFTVRGAGTVVTGTIWSGAVTPDAMLTLLPLGREVRVRGVQAHGAAVQMAGPGTRAALALVGVDLTQVQRGAVLVADATWPTTSRMRVDVALLDRGARPLRPRERVRLHLGTSDVGARIVAAKGEGGALAPGELRSARAILDEPIVARAGDRFVLRAASPPITIGGGVVRDPAPPHRRMRPWPPSLVDPVERLRLMLAEVALVGIPTRSLPVRLGATPAALGALLQVAGGEKVGDRVFASAALTAGVDRLVALVSQHLAQHPLESGVQQAASRAGSGAADTVFDEMLRRAVRAGRVELHDGLVRPPGWQPHLDEGQIGLRAAVLAQLSASRREPPSTQELVAQHGQQVIPLLRMLEKDRLVVAVEPLGARYFESQCLNELVQEMQGVMARGGEHSPAALRDALRMSRKFLIPFLEYCDREGITERQGGGRVLAGRASGQARDKRGSGVA